MEKTDVSLVGGESWERHRFISNVEENLITTNLILSMPPGVACFVQPNELAKVAFTSFVRVKDVGALPRYLSQYESVNETMKRQQQENTTTPTKENEDKHNTQKDTSEKKQVHSPWSSS